MKFIPWTILALALCAVSGIAAAQSAGTEQDADAVERAKLKELFDSHPVPNSTMKRWSITYLDGKVCESVADVPHCEAPHEQVLATQNFGFTVVCTTKDGTVTRSKEPRTIPAECR